MYTITLTIILVVAWGIFAEEFLWKRFNNQFESALVHVLKNKVALKLFSISIRVLSVLLMVAIVVALFGFFFWIGMWKAGL